MMSPSVLAVLIAYLLLMLFFGLWGRKDSSSLEGYYVAGKKLPSWVIAFSSNATGESGWLLLGLTGMGYMVGMHALWVVLGETLGVALAWALVGRPFKAYTDRYRAITVPDFLEARFDDRRRLLRFISAAIILTMVLAYLAAQLVATGKAFSAFLGMNYGTGVLLGAAITFFYTTVGGFKAVAYSDVAQGLLMAGGLFLLAVVGVYSAGGWLPLVEGLGQADPNLLLAMGEHGFSTPGVISALSFLGIGLAFLGVPHLLVRFISAKNQQEIASGGVIAVVCVLIFDLGAVFAGMSGRVLFPGLVDAETIMPLMSRELFPAVMTGVFVVVVLGAVMSTVDSLLILASSAVVRDLGQKVLWPDLSDRRLALYGRVVTILLGLGALPLALAEVRAIFWFILFAWSGLATAFAPVVLCALFWKRTTLAGAVSGMLSGFLVTVAWVLWFKTDFYELYEMLPGFAAGAAVTILVSLWTKPPAGEEAEFDEIRQTTRASW